MTAPRGWFADIDTDAPQDCRWQPCLQLDGVCFSFDVWFATETACVAFIEKDIVGRGLLTDQPSPLRSSLADRLTEQEYTDLVAEWTAKFGTRRVLAAGAPPALAGEAGHVMWIAT